MSIQPQKFSCPWLFSCCFQPKNDPSPPQQTHPSIQHIATTALSQTPPATLINEGDKIGRRLTDSRERNIATQESLLKTPSPTQEVALAFFPQTPLTTQDIIAGFYQEEVLLSDDEPFPTISNPTSHQTLTDASRDLDSDEEDLGKSLYSLDKNAPIPVPLKKAGNPIVDLSKILMDNPPSQKTILSLLVQGNS